MAREGLEVADAFRHFGPAFLDQHGPSLSSERRRAMSAIESSGWGFGSSSSFLRMAVIARHTGYMGSEEVAGFREKLGVSGALVFEEGIPIFRQKLRCPVKEIAKLQKASSFHGGTFYNIPRSFSICPRARLSRSFSRPMSFACSALSASSMLD